MKFIPLKLSANGLMYNLVTVIGLYNVQFLYNLDFML